MAQTKTKASAKRSGGSKKPQARSRGSTSKNGSTSKAKSRKPSSRSRGSRPAPVKAVGNAADKATSAVGDATDKATHAVSRAKVPLLAGGAAIAGAAGGLALGAHQARRGKGLGKAIARRPQVKVRSKDLASAAKDVGSFGAQLGHLANELQQARESGNGKHRSPLEVVLEGLTARRSRA